MKRQVARSKICFRLIDGLNCGLDPAADQSIGAHGQFVLQDQLQELDVIESIAGGLLQTHVQRLGKARESQLGQCSV